ncbi:MAG: YoaK family protein [Acidimicrobiales bacterium]
MTTTLTDAWRIVVPPAGDRHGPLQPLLLVLTVVTGLIDAFSYLVLGHVFVANMTGNVVFLAFALVGAKGFSIAASALALGAFVLGAVGSGRVVAHLHAGRGRMLAVSTACEALLVAAALAVGWTAAQPGSGAARYVLVLLLGGAAGMQNGTARKLAVPDLTTTVLTMTITGAAFDSRLAGGSGSRVGRRGLSAGAMFVGALIGASLVLHVAKPLGLLLALVLLVPVTVAAATLARSGPAWDRAG